MEPTVTPRSSMTLSNTVSFSNDETHIYMYTTGHSSGRVGVETSSGTTTVSIWRYNMNEYKDAQYCENAETKDKICIKVKINGSELYSYVPLDKGNSHYKEMMEMVDAKTLTIKDAE